jgi:hypothetical protein
MQQSQLRSSKLHVALCSCIDHLNHVDFISCAIPGSNIVKKLGMMYFHFISTNW